MAVVGKRRPWGVLFLEIRALWFEPLSLSSAYMLALSRSRSLSLSLCNYLHVYVSKYLHGPDFHVDCNVGKWELSVEIHAT